MKNGQMSLNMQMCLETHWLHNLQSCFTFCCPNLKIQTRVRVFLWLLFILVADVFQGWGWRFLVPTRCGSSWLFWCSDRYSGQLPQTQGAEVEQWRKSQSADPNLHSNFQSEYKDTKQQTSAGANWQPAELHGLQILRKHCWHLNLHTNWSCCPPDYRKTLKGKWLTLTPQTSGSLSVDAHSRLSFWRDAVKVHTYTTEEGSAELFYAANAQAWLYQHYGWSHNCDCVPPCRISNTVMIPGEARSGAEAEEDLCPRSMVGMKDRLMLGSLELRYLVRVRPSTIKSQLKDCSYLSNTSRWESRHQSDSSVPVQPPPAPAHTSPTFMRNCDCLHVPADVLFSVVSNQTMPLSLSPSVLASCLMFFRLTCGAVDADEEATFMCRS